MPSRSAPRWPVPESDAHRERVPVHVLTGFLGAGKTTLLNRLLTDRHGERIAVLVNEFGDVPIDGRLVVRSTEELIELANGCVCCTIRGDLARSLGGLFAPRPWALRRKPFSRVVIETSGLASPGPVLQTLVLEPELAAAARPAGVVALTHAARIAEELERHPEAREQLGYADLILLNHCDRTDASGRDGAEAAIRRLNALAPIRRTERADVTLDDVLALAPLVSAEIDLERVHAPHTPGAGTLVLRTEEPLDLHTLKLWLRFLASRRTHEIWRMKGILRCKGRDEAVVVQAVYQWLEIGPGEEPAPGSSVLVVIGRDLDAGELQRGWDTLTRGAG